MMGNFAKKGKKNFPFQLFHFYPCDRYLIVKLDFYPRFNFLVIFFINHIFSSFKIGLDIKSLTQSPTKLKQKKGDQYPIQNIRNPIIGLIVWYIKYPNPNFYQPNPNGKPEKPKKSKKIQKPTKILNQSQI